MTLLKYEEIAMDTVLAGHLYNAKKAKAGIHHTKIRLPFLLRSGFKI